MFRFPPSNLNVKIFTLLRGINSSTYFSGDLFVGTWLGGQALEQKIHFVFLLYSIEQRI